MPALIVIALGTLLWRTRTSSIPTNGIDPAIQPLEVQVVAQDWKWLFIYPEQGIAIGQRAGVSEPDAAQPEDHLGYGDELLLDPGAGRPDLCHGGHGDAAASAGRRARPVRRPQHAIQRRRLRQPVFRGDRHVAGGFRGLGSEGQAIAGQAGWRRLSRAGRAQRAASGDLLFGGRAGPVRHASSPNTPTVPGARRPPSREQTAPGDRSAGKAHDRRAAVLQLGRHERRGGHGAGRPGRGRRGVLVRHCATSGPSG